MAGEDQFAQGRWDFPKKLRVHTGSFFWGPYNYGSYYLGCYIGVPYVRKPPYLLELLGVSKPTEGPRNLVSRL